MNSYKTGYYILMKQISYRCPGNFGAV